MPRNRLSLLFFLLCLAQAAHSVEEYLGRLWETFPPARFLSGLLWPPNPVIGFLIINIGLVVLMYWCYFRVIRSGSASSAAWAWFFVLLEGINAIGHPMWAAISGGYVTGLGTSLPFLALVPLLSWTLRGSARLRPA